MPMLVQKSKLKSNEIEAANLAEVTAILIRAGYRLYRPEADVHGEDLLVRTPNGELLTVQMKSSPYVEWNRYGGRQIWMLFPDPTGVIPGRSWFLIEHDNLFDWMKDRHGAAPKWKDFWRDPRISVQLREFLQPFVIQNSVPEIETDE